MKTNSVNVMSKGKGTDVLTTVVKWHQIWLCRWIDLLDSIFCKSVRYLTQISYINLKSMCNWICNLMLSSNNQFEAWQNFTSMQGLHGCILAGFGDFCEGLTSVSQQLVLDTFDISLLLKLCTTCQYKLLL